MTGPAANFSTNAFVEEYTDFECEEEAPDRIKGFIQRAKITRADIDKYIGEFPLKTYKSIYDLRLESVLADN